VVGVVDRKLEVPWLAVDASYRVRGDMT
jgi:hypothetical protein